jgi:hypothetical protein
MPKFLKIFCFTLLVVGLLSFAYPVLAQGRSGPSSEGCPKGNVYCQYPGQCHDYVDSNNDNYCDRSIPTSTTSTVAASSTTPAASSSSQGAVANTTSSASATVSSDTSTTVNAPGNGQSDGSKYNLLLVFIIVIVTYGVTYVLSFTKVIKTLLHHRIWNIVLLVAAVVMLILGLLLTLREEYHLMIQLPFDLTFWHVETGIIMGIIAAFHIVWHWRYFFRNKPVTNG